MTINKKHVGILTTTGKRVALAMLQIPDAPLRALIIDMDALPPFHSELLRNVIASDAAQSAACLADVLGTTNVPGVGRSMMMDFHKHGFLKSESIDNITLTPTNTTAYKLRDVLASMGKLGVSEAMQTMAQHSVAQTKINTVENLSPEAQAEALLVEAELLMQDADRKREAAYSLVPSLRPVAIDEIAVTDSTHVQA